MKTVNEWIDAIHENAVNHGWWETDRSLSETLMLICSEWSEALEEARKGKPCHYYQKKPSCDECMIDDESDPVCVFHACPEQLKPEGIAVELIDGIIRILDLFGHENVRAGENISIDEMAEIVPDMSLCGIIHAVTQLTASCEAVTASSIENLLRCISIVGGWCNREGLSMELLIAEKHSYNITRPYKHGKRF